MVFCPECNRKVEDCQHFVQPLNSPPVEVFDPKIKTLAYQTDTQTLEIRFKNGQAWQLFQVPPAVYEELTRQTLSSFLKFIAHRYKPRPVRQPPDVEQCPACHREMTERHRTSGKPMRILWHCSRCNQSLWRSYANESVRERKSRFH